METTTNLGLKMPAGEEFYNVQHINDNMKVIDEKMTDIEKSAEKTGTDISEHMNNLENPHKVTAEQIGAIDTLISMEEVNASTDKTQPVGAGAIQELNSNLGGLRFGVDGDGNYGYYGADDSLIPFRNNVFARFFGFNATSETFLLPKGTYTFETLAGCFSGMMWVPYIYLYSSDGTLIRQAERNVLYETSYNSVPFSIIHSVETITLDVDTEVYLYHDEGRFSQFALSLIYK